MSFGINQLQIEPTSRATLRVFVASWDEHRHPVLFVGAGFSKHQARRRPDVPGDSQFGSWDDLMEKFRQRLADGDPAISGRLPTDPLRLAQHFESQFGRAALLDCVARQVPTADFRPGPAHDELRGVPWAAVVTTNYDDLLERALDSSRRVRRIVTDGDLTQRRTIDDIAVIKMHGDLSMRETIVLTEEDYRTYEHRQPGLSVKIRQLLIEHPLMFVGFSLSDPNFTQIDGWIRDTVGEVRLPSVAIVHSQPLASERSMWKARGIELVRLPDDEEMARLLSALGHERIAAMRAGAGDQRPELRVYNLEDKIRGVVGDAAQDLEAKVVAIVALLSEIVTSTISDRNGRKAVLDVAREFAWGWHGVLRSPSFVEFQDGQARRGGKDQGPSTKDIFVAMPPGHQRQLLMLVLEAGELSLRFNDGEILDTATALSGHGLSPDEQGLVALYQASIHRGQGDAIAARESIDRARKANPSKTIRARITAECRELLFLEGDAAGIAAELAGPLDEEADVLAMCRRGSDALLLGKIYDADRWYSQALDRARDKDELYVALWGQRAARSSEWPDNEQDHELAEKLRAIPIEERPQTRAAEDLIEQAGRAQLDGRPIDEVVGRLRRYLDALRWLGSPHSSSHNAVFPVESAARRAARLLLSVEDGADERDAESIKQALAMLNCYGLASDVGQLFLPRHCELLGHEPGGIAWARRFVSRSPTLPRSADARMTTGLCTIPLLDDSAIEGLVQATVARTDAWLVGNADKRLLRDWWRLLARSALHLPRSAVSRLLSSCARYLTDRRAAWIVWPEQFLYAFGLWRKGGQLDVDTARSLAGAAEQTLADVAVGVDGRRQMSATGVVRQLIACGLLGEDQQRAFAERADALLGAEFPALVDGGLRALPLACLVSESGLSSRNLTELASRATELVRRSLRSSSLDLTLYCMQRLVPLMSASERTALVDLLVGEVRDLPPELGNLVELSSVASILGALASAEPDQRERIVGTLRDWLESEPAAFGGLDGLEELAIGAAPVLATKAMEALLAAPERRRDSIISDVADWLRWQPPAPTLRPLLDTMLGFLVADRTETRCVAIRSVGRYLSAHSDESGPFRERAVMLLAALAAKDRDSLVRYAAAVALADVCQRPEDFDLAGRIARDATGSGLALDRRAAELLLLRLQDTHARTGSALESGSSTLPPDAPGPGAAPRPPAPGSDAQNQTS